MSKQIYDYNYIIYPDGRVYSIKSNRFLKPVLNRGTGYYQVGLYKDGVAKMFQLHRLVAEHFLENKNGKSQVNHIDGNKLNNHVDNLEFVTDSENKFHAYATGLKSKTTLAKPILQLNATNKELIREFESSNSASRELGINQGSISNCCIGRCRTYKGFIWKFKEQG